MFISRWTPAWMHREWIFLFIKKVYTVWSASNSLRQEVIRSSSFALAIQTLTKFISEEVTFHLDQYPWKPNSLLPPNGLHIQIEIIHYIYILINFLMTDAYGLK